MSDLISREALKKKIRKDYHPMDEIPFFEIMHVISDAPKAWPKAKWITTGTTWTQGVGMGMDWGEYLECSHCGAIVNDPTNYCPDCGYKMSLSRRKKHEHISH